jgi:hypothetical protein
MGRGKEGKVKSAVWKLWSIAVVVPMALQI